MSDKNKAPKRDISKYIRLRGAGEHNLKKQKKGASRLRKAISYILRVRFEEKGGAEEASKE